MIRTVNPLNDRNRRWRPSAVVAALFVGVAMAAADATAATVYWTPTRADADRTIYVSTARTGASCLVYLSKSRTEAAGKSGVWFVSPTRTDADLVLFRSRENTTAEVVVYFVASASEARCPALAR